MPIITTIKPYNGKRLPYEEVNIKIKESEIEELRKQKQEKYSREYGTKIKVDFNILHDDR
jgi:hypothetical protein